MAAGGGQNYRANLTRFERMTIGIAPRWTLKRIYSRLAVEQAFRMSRHYDAAQPGRRTQAWARTAGDADFLIRGALGELRMHARDLTRNNGWARRALQLIAHNTTGWGIRPKPVSEDPAIAEKAAALWKRWAESTECESEGRATFYGIQTLCMKAIAQDGEVLIRRRPRRVADDLTIPLQLQVLEADFLDAAKNADNSDAGGPIIAGVEFDLIGRRAAYWLFPAHPGSGRNFENSRRIPASEIIHVFLAERPGQSRGISWFAPAILTLKDLDEYEDAELMKQKIAACFAVFVTDPDGQMNPAIGGSDKVNGNQLVTSLEPGMVEALPPGKEIAFANPPGVTTDAFTTRKLRSVTQALGLTYEGVSGDYSQVNFSSARMGRLDHYGHVREWQNMLITLLCTSAWEWAMEAAQLAGELPDGDLPSADWSPPPMPMIEPDKEISAYVKGIRGGLTTLSAALREQGEDPDLVFAERAAENKKLDTLGIIVDSDPRKTTAVGQEQMSITAEATADAAPAEAPKPKDKKAKS
jgi:lambda family phage portal protein